MSKSLKKALIPLIIIVAAIVAVVIIFNVLGNSDNNSEQATIKEGVVSEQQIDTTISGAGQLKDDTAVDVTVPVGVEVSSYLVANSDEVEEGQALAVVDRTSVMNTIAEIEETLDYLEEKIESTEKTLSEETITAKTSGKVMKIYASEGDDVKSVIMENGALALVSIDGKMAFDFEAETDHKAGDTITVQHADGTTETGRIDSVVSGKVVVTCSDENAVLGETVSALESDGTVLGSGDLYIHSEWKAVASTGTVKSVNVTEGSDVESGTKMFVVSESGNTADFNVYTAQHRVYEEILQELFVLYQDQTVYAEQAGFVTGIDEDNVVELSSANSTDGTFVLLAINTPDGHDEIEYRNYAAKFIGLDEDAGLMTYYGQLQEEPLQVTDYKNVTFNDSMFSSEMSAMDIDETIKTLPVYGLDTMTNEWVAASLDIMREGDYFIIAFDENNQPVWIVFYVNENPEPSPDDPDDPDNPDEDWEEWGDGADSFGQGMSSSLASAYLGTELQETVFELYSQSVTTIMSITQKDTMSMQVTIDENDILGVSEGQEATVVIDAIKGQSFKGTVSTINTTGKNSGGNTKYTVTVELPRDDRMLSGMTATAVITTATNSNVVSVPTAALYDKGAKTYVYTGYVDGELANPVEVETGVSDGTNTEIKSGLSTGTKIYYEYNDKAVVF